VTLSSRLGDYGITGTFFLVSQVIAFMVVDPVAFEHRTEAILDFLQQLVSTAPALSAPLASLLAVLAFILVFFVGLVIDLLPFYAQSLEVVTFRKRIETHRHWLGALFERHRVFLEPDVRRFIDEYKPAPAIEDRGRSWLVIANYERIFNFLLVLALEYAKASTAQVVRDRMSLWRTSRAIATVLILLAVEAIICGFSSFRWVIMETYVICALLSLIIVHKSFHLVCESIFPVLYLEEHGSAEGGRATGQVS
jgi:hypothetical protein